jgi:Fe-S-cluster containining protein
MENKYKEDSFIKSRPQRLCLKCGRCCKVVTTELTYNELTKMAEAGDKESMDFLDIFEPYESIEKAKKVDKKTVDNILSKIKTNDIIDEKNITFYKCKYLLDNNLCEIYKNRKELCYRFPSSLWAIIPPGCGFEGWFFEKKEEIKKIIRKQKEEILDLEILLIESKTEEQKQKIKKIKENIESNIKKYEKYGAMYW